MDKNTSINDLVEEAQALLAKLKDGNSPDIQALRDKVQAGIADAKKSMSGQWDAGSDKVRAITGSVVDFVQENPWAAVAAAAAVGVALLFVAFSGDDRRDRQ